MLRNSSPSVSQLKCHQLSDDATSKPVDLTTKMSKIDNFGTRSFFHHSMSGLESVKC